MKHTFLICNIVVWQPRGLHYITHTGLKDIPCVCVCVSFFEGLDLWVGLEFLCNVLCRSWLKSWMVCWLQGPWNLDNPMVSSLLHQIWHVIYYWNTLINTYIKIKNVPQNSKTWIYRKPSNLFLALVLRDLLYECGNNGNGFPQLIFLLLDTLKGF